MRFRAVAGLVLAAVLVLSGCAAQADEATGSAAAAAGTTSIFDFTGTTLDGSSYDGQQLAGKPTVLWFWAPWCPTCRAQAGEVSAVAQKYDGTVNVVGVGGLADEADITDFAEQVEGPTHLVDLEGEVWRHFGITAQSTYVVVDADGGIVSEGYLDNDALSAQVADLVG